MKQSLWFKNNVNNYQNNCESAHEKGNLPNMTTSGIKKKPKRVRSAFTTDQVNYLEREYKKYPYIGTGRRKEIATTLNMSERTVKIWFQNRRMKEKRETISKEFGDEQTGRQQVQFAKSQLNNVMTVQSANDQSLNSLPLLTSDFNNSVKSIMNNNAFNIERHRETAKNLASRYIQKPNLHKNRSDSKLSTFLKSRGSLKDSKSSTQSSIDSCKKYIKLINNLQTKSNDTSVKKQGSMMNKSFHSEVSPEDLTTKKVFLQPDQKTCAGYSHGISGYVPVARNYYPQSFVTPEGVLWKPVNIMSVMPRACSTISSNDFNNAIGTAEQNSATKMCNCNCHSKTFPISMGIQNVPASPQYVLTALPLHNPSTKF